MGSDQHSLLPSSCLRGTHETLQLLELRFALHSTNPMKLYGIPNCNTVKKARTWLADNHMEVQFHDFKKDGVDAALINGWLQQVPWQKLVNRAGMTWRGLSDEAKASVQDNASALGLMLGKPSVIKRPVLVDNGKILHLGFDETEYGKLLKNE